MVTGLGREWAKEAMKDRPGRGLGVVLALAGVAACHARGPAPPAAAYAPGPAESAYRAPPTLAAAVRQPGGRVLLVGRATPGAQVRLATPAGAAMFADCGLDGLWRMTLASSAAPRLYGLSMIDHGRLVQAEGYIALSPRGEAVQLRAGAGALVLGDSAPGDGAAGPRILAVDFDSKGGAVVSGRAPPRARVEVRVDGGRAVQGAAGADGWVSLALDQPLTFGAHTLILAGLSPAGGSGGTRVQARLTAAAPLAGGPYRAMMTPFGWRIDWLTPGGGLQTTLLLTGAA